MKFFLATLISCSPLIAFCQTDEMARVRQELAEDRQQLNVIVRSQPPPARIVSIPGESNQERAQRHEHALIDASESWKTEWGQEHPFKSSIEAPPMPDEMRNDAIRDSDASYVAEHSRASSTSQQNDGSSDRIRQLRARIASLESLLAARNGIGNSSPSASDIQRSTFQQQHIANAWKKVKVGMKKADVLAALGKPNANTGKRWNYSGFGLILFDGTDVVESIEPVTFGDQSESLPSTDPGSTSSHGQEEVGVAPTTTGQGGAQPTVSVSVAKPSAAIGPESNQTPSANGPAVSGVLKILSASYGAENTFQDVTSFVQGNVRNGNCSMRVGNDTLGGDPIGGKTKTLRIRYQFGGQIYDTAFTEGSEVRIP